MAIQGVNTEISAMKTAATQATNCAERLDSAVRKLTGQVHSDLGTWQGDATPVYWSGHEEHVNNVGRLVQSLHKASDSINRSGNHYDSTDQDNMADQSRVTGAGSGINLGALL